MAENSHFSERALIFQNFSSLFDAFLWSSSYIDLSYTLSNNPLYMNLPSIQQVVNIGVKNMKNRFNIVQNLVQISSQKNEKNNEKNNEKLLNQIDFFNSKINSNNISFFSHNSTQLDQISPSKTKFYKFLAETPALGSLERTQQYLNAKLFKTMLIQKVQNSTFFSKIQNGEILTKKLVQKINFLPKNNKNLTNFVKPSLFSAILRSLHKTPLVVPHSVGLHSQLIPLIPYLSQTKAQTFQNSENVQNFQQISKSVPNTPQTPKTPQNFEQNFLSTFFHRSKNLPRSSSWSLPSYITTNTAGINVNTSIRVNLTQYSPQNDQNDQNLNYLPQNPPFSLSNPYPIPIPAQIPTIKPTGRSFRHISQSLLAQEIPHQTITTMLTTLPPSTLLDTSPHVFLVLILTNYLIPALLNPAVGAEGDQKLLISHVIRILFHDFGITQKIVKKYNDLVHISELAHHLSHQK
jgi:hypothetical protein